MTIFWEPSYNCNLNCLFCYNDKSADNNFSVNKDLVMDKFLEMKVSEVILAGGEPLVLADLSHIIRRLSMSAINCHIITNGTLVSDDFITKYQMFGYNKITVSIDGCQEQHDLIRGKGNYRKALEGIEKLVKAGLQVYITVTINKINLDSMIELYHNLSCLGVYQIYYGRCLPTISKALQTNLLRKEDLIRLWENYNIMKRNNYSFEIDKQAFYFFLSGNSNIDACDCVNEKADFLRVKPNGAITLCPHLNLDIAHILDDTKEQILKKIIKFKRREMAYIPKSCSVCKFAEKCAGGCRAVSYTLYGDFLHSDYLCPLNEKLKLLQDSGE